MKKMNSNTEGRVLHKAAYLYDILNPVFSFFQNKKINRHAVELLCPEENDQILDLGCATGEVALIIADKISNKGDIFGLDASKEMICVAKTKINGKKNIHFDLGIAEELPYDSESFDKVISTFFYHHLNQKAKLKSLNEIYRILKPNGKFLLVDIDIPRNLFAKAVMKSAESIFRQPEIGENRNGLLRELFKKSKFQTFSIKHLSLGYVTYFQLEK